MAAVGGVVAVTAGAGLVWVAAVVALGHQAWAAVGLTTVGTVV